MENPFSSKKYNDNSDELYIKNTLDGDKKSLNSLLEKHQDYIYNIALKMLNDVSDAQDATQEILIKLLTNLSKYDSSKSKFRTWLYRITFNYILDLKKSPYENIEPNFTKFFGFMESVPDIPIEEEELSEFEETIEEAKIGCMAGMLMCLSREQRLIYIVGEVFKIDHNLASEIFEITSANFRKKLSRARKDLYSWMHNKCGLVNKENPCRCRNKTKFFINEGHIDTDNLKWNANYKIKMYQLSSENIDDTIIARDQVYNKLYSEHPFKINLKANEVLNEIVNHKEFNQFLNLE